MQKERGETIKPHSLRKILIEKTLASDRSIDGQINSIDLGVFGKEAEGLLKRSFADPKGRERGRLVIVTSLGDIQIQKKRHSWPLNKKRPRITSFVFLL